MGGTPQRLRGRMARRRSAEGRLEGNREIGKPIGLMMAFLQIYDEAFQRRRKTSQDLNVNLASVAQGGS